MREDAPLVIDTSALRHPKCFATKAMSSSFALPSTSGDFICAIQVPSAVCSSALERELGLTFIRMTLGGIV
jgi:hypothetical protein